jgi:hypothetical protein
MVKRNSYSLELKYNVIRFYYDHTLEQTKERFGISKSLITKWKVQEEFIEIAKNRRNKYHLYLKSKHSFN